MNLLKTCSALLFILISTSYASTNNQDLKFTTLFEKGADLEQNWIGNFPGYKVVDDTLVIQNRGGNIYTKKAYQDYVFQFEFKLEAGANNGVGIRAPHPQDRTIKRHDPAYSTVEIQILDNTAPKYAKLKDYQFHGSAYGIAAAKKGAEKALGEWNQQEIRLQGNHLIVTLNNQVILDTDISEGDAGKYALGRNRASGHICFAGHGPGVAIRNVKVAELDNSFTLAKEDNIAPEAFTALFDGKSFTNWKGLLERPFDKPHKRRGLAPEKLKALQAKADESMNQHWHLQDGVLFFDGGKGGHSLVTAKKYGNFEFHCSWKIAPNSDSGLYLRGLPQVQIWDPADVKAHKHGSDKGSGGLWNNKKLGRWPLVVADKPAGEWNHFFIRMIGDRVTIWLNSKLIVNDAPLENLWEKGKPIPVMEQIELQCHGDPVWFKNISIREL
ncbi:DUF1080 domain-containing protein [Lentisphaera profundi]|uniref:DUF1080 domain-containing protein n=1 Tax=Lentisphaera profundi TaxID=1658616 RepID=A0ABY7W0G0_9BACT|nr:DUF1080 domain-containing protein [Lentisphaera profundi]WDE98607.1 DUF1080 domain-containing protein [Lentisphaera profundi]